MYTKQKTISLITLYIVSLLSSKIAFWFLNDPEGPNLLIVIVFATILYFSSLVIYLYIIQKITHNNVTLIRTNLAKLLIVILIQTLTIFLISFFI
ncbi:MAG: hypothetical protein KBB50_04395 [Candidatus Pacebacteria bacterium]|nr:hypothetical protein [Candidatus Paceibacterota bacterium]